MKRIFKTIGLTAFVAVIGFTLAACSNGDTSIGNDCITLGHDWNVARETVSMGVKAITCKRTNCAEKKDFDFEYKVGDTMPDGGIIFFVADGDGTIIPGYEEPAIKKRLGFTFFTSATDTKGITAYYLVAASVNITPRAWAQAWSPAYTDLVAGLSESNTDRTDWDIGRGKKNTALILTCVSNNEDDAPAAYACDNYGAPNEWFLPSKDELYQLYANRTSVGISSGAFWSSSQNNSASALYQLFNTFGLQANNVKHNTTMFNVRAIRAF